MTGGAVGCDVYKNKPKKTIIEAKSGAFASSCTSRADELRGTQESWIERSEHVTFYRANRLRTTLTLQFSLHVMSPALALAPHLSISQMLLVTGGRGAHSSPGLETRRLPWRIPAYASPDLTRCEVQRTVVIAARPHASLSKKDMAHWHCSRV